MNKEENVVCNEKTEFPTTKELNDNDIIIALNENLKNISSNMTTALNEVSNDTLYKKLFPIFKETKDLQRDVFELMFVKGWYKLEKAESTKINQKFTELNGKITELT
jgi:Coat F domain.